MRRCTRSFIVCAASAALVLASVTGCGQARPEEQSEGTAGQGTTVQTEAVPAVTEVPIVIQTEAPQTEPETQPQTQPQTQPPETEAPQTQASETPAPVPDSLSEEEELNQLYEFADEEIGTRFANADMNVRQSPTTEGDNIISSLDKGEEVTVIGETANWYEIYKAEDTVTGMTDLRGFVMKRYMSGSYDEAMAAQPEETAPAAQSVEAQPVEARPEAAPDQSAEVQVAEENAPAEQQAAPEAAASAPASTASGPQVTVTSDANIRSEAYETASVVGVVTKGSTVTQIGSSDGWVQVDYNGVQGYIKASMVG